MRNLISILFFLLIFSVEAQQRIELCEDNRRNFTYSSFSNEVGNWQWSINGEVKSTENQLEVEWTSIGSYEIKVNFTSLCESEEKYFIVNVVECRSPSVFFSNCFTPNDDNVNDEWGPVATNLSEIEWSVWNRWGELIFQSTNSSEKWTGFYKNQKVPDGIYTYQSSWIDVFGKSDRVIGHVSVIR